MAIFKKITHFLNKLRRKKKQEEQKKEKPNEPDSKGNDGGRRSTVIQDSFKGASIFSSWDTMPTYYNIGWLAKKCLHKYYHYGAWHLNCTSTEFNDINWLSMFSFGDVGQKFEYATGGIGVRETFDIFELSQSWQTDAYVSTIGCIYETAAGILSTLLKAAYVTENDPGVQSEIDVGYEYFPFKILATLPIVKPDKLIEGFACLMPHENFLLGFRCLYDYDAWEFSKHIFALGFKTYDTELSLKLKNFETVRCSVFQRLSWRWALALKAKLYGEDASQFSVGGQYFFDNLLVKARIKDDGLFGLVFKHYIYDGIEAIYHLGCNAQHPFETSDYKFGVGWSLFC